MSIGKLHFRATEDDNGFSEEILPLHVLDGIGDLIGMLREPPARRGSMPALAESAGPGNSTYNDYDSAIAAAACDWIAAHAGRSDKPWALFVSFVRPHFPLTAPPEFYKLYPPERMAMPRLYDAAGRPRHPAIAALKTVMNYDDFFKDEQIVRRAVASYYALVSFLDHNIGQVSRRDRAGRADVVDPRDLHLRSRRQPRLPRTLGQVGDVRGVGRDPDDRRGRRCRPRRRRRYAGFPDRLLPHRARSGRLPAVAGRSRDGRRIRCGASPRARGPTARCCRNITRSRR